MPARYYEFHFVDVEFEKPVSHPRKDVKQAAGGVDVELRGESPAAMNLGAVTVLMVFKAEIDEITKGADIWRAGGTLWHRLLLLPGRATLAAWSGFAEGPVLGSSTPLLPGHS